MLSLGTSIKNDSFIGGTVNVLPRLWA